MSEPLAAPEQITLRIISPEEILFERHVRWVQIPLEDGLIGVWPGHAPLVAMVAEGKLTFDDGHGERALSLNGGILRISPEECTILVGLPQGQPAPAAVDKEALFADLEESLSSGLPEEQIQRLQKE